MKRIYVSFFLALLVLGLSGCSVLNPGPAPAQLVLSPEMPVASGGKMVPRQLVVAEATVESSLDSDRIAAVFNGFELRFVHDLRWSSPVPWMMKRFLLNALQATGRFEGVAEEDSGIRAGIGLLTDVKCFNLRYPPDGGPLAEVEFRLALLDKRTGSVVGSVVIREEEALQGQDPGYIALAFNSLLTRAMDKAAVWTVATAFQSLEAGKDAPQPGQQAALAR